MTRFTSAFHRIRRPLVSVCVCVWRNSLILILTTAFLLSIPIPSFAYYTNMNASVVLGQSNFTSSSSGLSSSAFNAPNGMIAVGNRLFVADSSNNRVLIWNQIPTQNNTPADIVLGQPDFVSNTADNGGISCATFEGVPGQLTVTSDGRLLVGDRRNYTKRTNLKSWNLPHKDYCS